MICMGGNAAMPPKKVKKPTKPKDLDLDPDAWLKFEEMIRKVSKAGPQHRETPKPNTFKKTKPA